MANGTDIAFMFNETHVNIDLNVPLPIAIFAELIPDYEEECGVLSEEYLRKVGTLMHNKAH